MMSCRDRVEQNLRFEHQTKKKYKLITIHKNPTKPRMTAEVCMIIFNCQRKWGLLCNLITSVTRHSIKNLNLLWKSKTKINNIKVLAPPFSFEKCNWLHILGKSIVKE